MNLYAAAVIFLLGCVGAIILYKRGGKHKMAAAACAAVSLLALLYIVITMFFINGIN